MVELRHVATLVGRSDMPLATVTDLVVSGGLLYTVTRSDGGIGVFDISGSGAPVLLGQAAYRSSQAMAGFAPTAVILPLSGSTSLLMPAGLNGSANSAYGLGATGLFGAAVRWDSTATLPPDLAVISPVAGAQAPVFIAARSDGSLLPATLVEGRRLAAQSPDTPPPQAGGAVTALETLRIGAETLLVTASSQGQSLVSYAVSPDLRLARRDLVDGQDSGIGFSNPSTLKTVTLGSDAYVVLAGSASSSLTVFRLMPTGTLIATDHIVDSRDTRFQWVSVVETITLGEQVFVLASGADDGLSLFTLLPGGHLIHRLSVADTPDTSLAAISALAVGVASNGQGQIFVASSRETGLTRLALIVEPGIVRQGGTNPLVGTNGDDLLMAGDNVTLVQGGAGNDLLVSAEGAGPQVRLEGGAGADVFVIRPGARVTTLTDFSPGTDRLDLTLLPMLRDISQLSFTPTPTGIVLGFRDSVIEIISAQGQSLTSEAFSTASLLPMARYAPVPSDPPSQNEPPPDDDPPVDVPQGQEIRLPDTGGTANAGDGDDTLLGGAGNDTLRGNGGNDIIDGGAGDDNIGGGPGNDLIRVLSGANVIWGGLGNDTVEGGRGADTINGGGDGRNRLLGNDGDDWIFAGGGGDFIAGGAGNDLIRGGPGADTIYAGFGDDNIGGGAGNDVIFGSAGNNIIYGGLGNDTVQGGSGSDTIVGSAGVNQLLGNDGNDLIYTSAGGDFAAGGAGNDSIFGSDGADTIYAGLGDDFIGGGAGNDAIFAGAGSNRIFGGLGNDTITAGSGKDVITGGPGADVFVFASAAAIGIGAARDVITDFTPGVDDIDLRALGTSFNGTAGVLGGGTASFFYFASGGLLIGDQNGDGAADWVLELTGAPAVTASDFLL